VIRFEVSVDAAGSVESKIVGREMLDLQAYCASPMATERSLFCAAAARVVGW
jgi:hypothetical protein